MNDPPAGSDLSREQRLSLQHPGVPDVVRGLSDFRRWVNSLPTVVVDGVKYHVRGGDMLADEDQVLWEWARRNRPDLVPPESHQGGDDA